MDYRIQIFQLENHEWAVWYKDDAGLVQEKYDLKDFEAVSRFVENELL